MRLTLDQVKTYISADAMVEPADGSTIASAVTWDSREVKPGSIYVAFSGEKVDGHVFVEPSIKQGAVAALVMHDPGAAAVEIAKEKGAALYLVPSTEQAFTDLAAGWRGHIKGHVIALTGSTGKTTTKNLSRDVLSTTFKTVATKANQNNELGVPKTLLDADADTECVVVEMGMRGLGQLRSLCTFVKPDISLNTNVGDCHIELLGSKQNIARAKSEVIEALRPQLGIAVVNKADPYTPFMLKNARAEQKNISVKYYDGSGESGEGALVFAKDIFLGSEGNPTFTLVVAGESKPCTLSLRGIHNVANACAAAALGSICGVSIDKIVEGLSSSQAESGRQEVLTNNSGITIINDAYNANPDSMKASLAMFVSMKVTGKRYAVLGDMGELGSFAKELHESVGRYLASLGSIDTLICIGELSQHIASAAVQAGFDTSCVITTNSKDFALAELKTCLIKGDAVLVKASHSMELERVVKGLLD